MLSKIGRLYSGDFFVLSFLYYFFLGGLKEVSSFWFWFGLEVNLGIQVAIFNF